MLRLQAERTDRRTRGSSEYSSSRSELWSPSNAHLSSLVSSFFQQIGKFVFFHVEGEGTLVNTKSVLENHWRLLIWISWKKKTLHLTATIRRSLIISMIAKWRESRAETSGTVLKGDKRVRILQLQNGTSVGGETESGRIVYHPVTQNVVRWLPMDQHNPYTVHVILRFPLYLFCRDESVAVPTMVNVITGNGADHLWWTLLINV